MNNAVAEYDTMFTRQELMAKLGRSRETFRQWVKAGKIPPPDVDLSRKTKGWKKSTLAAAGIKL